MRIEDGLVVFLALAAGGLLLAGLAQALDGRPRMPRPRRRGERRAGQARAVEGSPVGPPLAGSEAGRLFADADPGERARLAMPVAPEPAAADAAPSPPEAAEPAGEAAARQMALLATAAPAPEADAAVTPVAEPAAPASPAAEPPAAPTADVPACLRAYEAGDQDSAERAAAGLARMRPGGKRGKRGDGGGVPLEQVALWSALALSRHARGDEVGGAAAFEAGARWAGAVTTRRIPASIDGLAPRLGRDLLTAAEALRHRSPGRRAALRLASTWLAATARERPGDGEASALAERAVGGFADAVTAEIVEQVARRDFAGAQGTLEDALAGIAVPEARRAELRDLPWTAITGEIGRLVGDALYGAGGGQTSGAGENGGGQTSGAGNADEQGGGAVDAMAALSAAARVVAEIPPDALTPERHHELSRRLWWAHLQVGGELRVRGQLDRAVAPLLRALELAAGDPPREAEARGAAALVIDALAERLGHDIRARLANGDVGGAMAASRRLGAAVDDALSRGLSTEDVAGALARRQEVLLELAEGRPA